MAEDPQQAALQIGDLIKAEMGPTYWRGQTGIIVNGEEDRGWTIILQNGDVAYYWSEQIQFIRKTGLNSPVERHLIQELFQDGFFKPYFLEHVDSQL